MKKEYKGLYVYIINKKGFIEEPLFRKLEEKALFKEKLVSGIEAIIVAYDSIEDKECLEYVDSLKPDLKINVVSNIHIQSYRGSECIGKYIETPLTYGLDDKTYFGIESDKCKENPLYAFSIIGIELAV